MDDDGANRNNNSTAKTKKKNQQTRDASMLLPGLVPIVWVFFFLVIELLQKTRREIEKDVSMASHA